MANCLLRSGLLRVVDALSSSGLAARHHQEHETADDGDAAHDRGERDIVLFLRGRLDRSDLEDRSLAVVGDSAVQHGDDPENEEYETDGFHPTPPFRSEFVNTPGHTMMTMVDRTNGASEQRRVDGSLDDWHHGPFGLGEPRGLAETGRALEKELQKPPGSSNPGAPTSSRFRRSTEVGCPDRGASLRSSPLTVVEQAESEVRSL